MLCIYFSDRTFCIAPKGKIAAFGNYQVKKTRSHDVDAWCFEHVLVAYVFSMENVNKHFFSIDFR